MHINRHRPVLAPCPDLRTSVIHGCDGPTIERLHDDGRIGTTGGLIPLSVVMQRVVAQVAARRLANGGGR